MRKRGLNVKMNKLEKSFFSDKEKMLYTEKIQPVAAAHGAIWESDKMVTMNDLIDEADFAEFFDTG